MKHSERDSGIIRDAVDGLVEYYPRLTDETFAQELASTIEVPDTGQRAG